MSGERLLLDQLSPLGHAWAWALPDGRTLMLATHVLALLRLIEQRGQVQIRVTPDEAQVLTCWPRWPLVVTVATDTAQAWAEAAVEVLRAGPPRVAGRTLWMIIMLAAALSFTLGWMAMQHWYG